MPRAWLRRERIHAVHQQDLSSVLEELGILDRLTAGSLRCAACGSGLTLDNLQCLYMEGGDIKACCIAIECYRAVLARTGVRSDE